MIESTMTWGEAALVLFVFIVTVSFIGACIETARDQDRKIKEREENRQWQLK